MNEGCTASERGWIDSRVLRMQIGPLMREAIIQELADAEREQSGRTLLRYGVEGSLIVHFDLASAVARWYRDQPVLLSGYTPTRLSAQIGEERMLKRYAEVDEALRDREGGA